MEIEAYLLVWIMKETHQESGLASFFTKDCNIPICFKNCEYVFILSLYIDYRILDLLLHFVIINHGFIMRLFLFSLAVIKLSHVLLPPFQEYCFLGPSAFEVYFEFW